MGHKLYEKDINEIFRSGIFFCVFISQEVLILLFFTGARAVIEATPSSSQQLVLDQLLQNVTSTPSFSNNCSHLDQENVFESVIFFNFSYLLYIFR